MAWFRRDTVRTAPPVADVPDPEDAPEALLGHLEHMVTLVNRASGDLPPVSVVQAQHLLDTLRRIIDLGTVRTLDVHAAITVRRTLTDYLPTTLDGYERVPDHARFTPRRDGVSPARSLARQIDALTQAAASTLAAVETEDVDALLTQGAFLTTKFSRSDLDL